MFSFGRFIGLTIAVLLIFIGTVLLLNNLGYIIADPFELIGIFWPVLLIAIGLYFIWLRVRPMPKSKGVAVSESLNGAARGDITIEFGAGELRLYSLGDSNNLFEGNFELKPGVALVRRGDLIEVKLNQWEWPWFASFPGGGADNWHLGLTRRIPLNLRLNTGASRVFADLTGNRVESIELNTGASDVLIRLPRSSGLTRVIAKGGATSIRLEVPQGVTAKIRSTGALSTLNVDEKRFPRSDGSFTSPDFDSAGNRIDIEIMTGVSSVTVV